MVEEIGKLTVVDEYGKEKIVQVQASSYISKVRINILSADGSELLENIVLNEHDIRDMLIILAKGLK